MAVKDVERYAAQVNAQLHQMQEDVKDYEEAYNNGQISIDTYNQAVEQINIIKENAARVNYILFLLHSPQRDKKKERYAKQNKKLLEASKGGTLEDVMAENNEALTKLEAPLKK